MYQNNDATAWRDEVDYELLAAGLEQDIGSICGQGVVTVHQVYQDEPPETWGPADSDWLNAGVVSSSTADGAEPGEFTRNEHMHVNAVWNFVQMGAAKLFWR